MITAVSLNKKIDMRKSYARLLDSVMSDPQMLNSDDSVLNSQYYKLRDVLKRYREIEKQGGWKTIDPELVEAVKKY
jgi:hypothetical protein